jgi:hypothetical protein
VQPDEGAFRGGSGKLPRSVPGRRFGDGWIDQRRATAVKTALTHSLDPRGLKLFLVCSSMG